MTMFRIPEEEAEELARMPETAMGFQIFELRLRGWQQDDLFLALNSKYLSPASDLDGLMESMAMLIDRSHEELREDPELRRAEVVGITRRIEVEQITAPVVTAGGPRLRASLLDPAVESTERVEHVMRRQPLTARPRTSGPKAYFRFSQFSPDRRVMASGGFRAGTYATTANDLRMVPSGFAAVGRYALPNPMAARYVYPLVTDVAPAYVGATVPNYGQAGGGVEVLFDSPATPRLGTPWTIPDE